MSTKEAIEQFIAAGEFYPDMKFRKTVIELMRLLHNDLYEDKIELSEKVALGDTATAGQTDDEIPVEEPAA